MKTNKVPMNERGRPSNREFYIMMSFVIPLTILFGYLFVTSDTGV